MNGNTPGNAERLIPRHPSVELDATTRAKLNHLYLVERNGHADCPVTSDVEWLAPDCDFEDRYNDAVADLARHLDAHPMALRREAVAQYADLILGGRGRVIGWGGPYLHRCCGSTPYVMPTVCVVDSLGLFPADPNLDVMLTDFGDLMANPETYLGCDVEAPDA
jgi:hypothetical protein